MRYIAQAALELYENSRMVDIFQHTRNDPYTYVDVPFLNVDFLIFWFTPPLNIMLLG